MDVDAKKYQIKLVINNPALKDTGEYIFKIEVQGGSSITLKSFGPFLGSFSTLFGPGSTAFEAVYTGIISNLTLGQFSWPIIEIF